MFDAYTDLATVWANASGFVRAGIVATLGAILVVAGLLVRNVVDRFHAPDILETCDRMGEAARDLVNQGRYDEALDLLNRAIRRATRIAEGETVPFRIQHADVLLARGLQENDVPALSAAAGEYRTLLAKPGVGDLPQALDWCRVSLADSLRTLGLLHGDAKALREAAALYRTSLEGPVLRDAHDQGALYNSLGVTLMALGELENGPGPYALAVTALRSALNSFRQEDVRCEYAGIQANIGSAFLGWGEVTGEISCLGEAARACREGLAAVAGEGADAASISAKLQATLGMALLRQGLATRSVEHMEQGLAAFRAVAAAHLSDNEGFLRVLRQLDLGQALRQVADRVGGTVHLEEALEVYSAARAGIPEADMPVQWAIVTSRIGMTLWILASRTGDEARFDQAAEAFRRALAVPEFRTAPEDVFPALAAYGGLLATRSTPEARSEAMSIIREAMEAPEGCFSSEVRVGLLTDLARLHEAAAEQRDDSRDLGSAVALYRQGLGLVVRGQDPGLWASLQRSLANALLLLGQRESRVDLLEASVAASRASLEVFDREQSSADHGSSLNNLSSALALIGHLTRNAGLLKEAVAGFETILRLHGDAGSTWQSATIQHNLGSALSNLGQLEGDPAALEGAVRSFRQASETTPPETSPREWALTQVNLGTSLRYLGQMKRDRALLEESRAAYERALEVPGAVCGSGLVEVARAGLGQTGLALDRLKGERSV